MHKTIHIVSRLLDGGTEQGLSTLIKGGFYGATDLSVVELVKGNGNIRDTIINQIGRDRVTALINRVGVTTPWPQTLPELLWRMNSAFNTIKPDTVVLSHLMATVVGRTAAIAHPNIKVISFEHTTHVASKNETPLRLTSWRSDAVFADSQETLIRREHGYLNTPPSYAVPLVVIPASEPRNGDVPEKIKILSLGRLSHDKNYRELIHAIALLRREGHNIELTIAGEGEQRSALEKTIRDLDTESPAFKILQHINLPGFISEAKALRELQEQSHIYPS